MLLVQLGLLLLLHGLDIRLSHDTFLNHHFVLMWSGTQLEDETLRCCYSATEDGWSVRAFHDRVDGYGAALVVARTQASLLCGPLRRVCVGQLSKGLMTLILEGTGG